MVKNLVELLINLVSSKTELLFGVSHYAVYVTFSNENTTLSSIKKLIFPYLQELKTLYL